MANAFEDDIKSGDFHRCYLLAGDEPYLVKYRKNSLIKALVKEGDEMNLTVFDEKDIDASNISKVKDIAETMPFFAEKRVVVLISLKQRLLFLQKKKSIKETDSIRQ